MNLLIKNGLIVNANKSQKADIFIQNNKIKEIDANISKNIDPKKYIDATDMLIFPGGIDPHVHMHLPSPAGYSSDDFRTGSKAALSGGTTGIIDFVTPQRGQSIVEALKLRKEEAKSCLINYKFHVSPVEWTKNTEREILYCIHEEGIKSFKVYMAYKNTIGLGDEDILKVMKVVGKAGGIVTVHAELGDDIELLRNKFADERKLAPEYHPLSRPAEMEAKAVKRAIEMAAKTNCPLYIVHVSTKESINYICQAQANSQEVYAETCPHYLLLDDSKYKGDFDEVSPFVLSPPLRKKADQETLWNAIADGIVQTIGTDHCPFNSSQKRAGKDDFRKTPNGAGSVEHRLTLLYTYGVLKKRININQFVGLTSTSAAKIFGLAPENGEIKVGSKANLIVWNPKIRKIISAKTHQMNCDRDIFEGFETIGAPAYVICNDKVVYRNSEDII